MSAVAQMPVTLLVEHQNALSKYKQGIGHFAAMQDYLVYCSVQDPAERVPPGYNVTSGVSVWGRGGKILLNAKSYMDVIDGCRPDWYQALCDSDTDRTSSRKRIRKSVDRTLAYTDSCIDLQAGLPGLVGCGVIAAVEGGFCIDERLRSARETAKKPVNGFSIEGFHSFGPEVEQFDITEISDILTTTLAELPADKPRLLPGAYTPIDVLRAVRLGIDIFDSSYPYVVTGRGGALVFSHDVSSTSSSASVNGHQTDKKPFEISLGDSCYTDDLSPLLDDCQCYTCVGHSRAYIHHLLETSELLAGVLLMIHNFHHYFGFFRSVRQAIVDGTFDVLEHHLLTSHDLYRRPVTAANDVQQQQTPTIAMATALTDACRQPIIDKSQSVGGDLTTN
jgi:queuine tRNA-ribosyltransferase subunit QTRTD1